MATKYELATELRALNRGMKALPICKMKKHELEAEIDRIKLMKQIKEDVGEYPPTKPGPLGPRPIPVAEAKTEDVTIAVPVAPAKHLTEATKPKKIKMKVGETVHFDDAKELFPTYTTATSVRAIPTKALPDRSAGKFSHPGAPKRSPADRVSGSEPYSSAGRAHTCNCPACPEKAPPA